MLLLVSGATTYQRDDTIGDLIVPRARNDPAALTLHPQRWAMDNGAYSGFDEGVFMRMLEAYAAHPGCLFATSPDVVADAAATLARWPFWSRVIRACGFPPAFVAQDGLPIARVPWGDLGALFIGGSTAYKESGDVRTLCAYAKARGIWIHWGRVNSQRRYNLATKAGADSIDGSGFSWYPRTRIPMITDWQAAIDAQPELQF